MQGSESCATHTDPRHLPPPRLPLFFSLLSWPTCLDLDEEGALGVELVLDFKLARQTLQAHIHLEATRVRACPTACDGVERVARCVYV